MGFPHIAIFLLASSYGPKTSHFMIKMLVWWVRIKFGWKLSRQFLGIFFYENPSIFRVFFELWNWQGAQNLLFLIIYITHNTNIWLFPVWVGRTPPKGVFQQLKVPASSSELIKMIKYSLLLINCLRYENSIYLKTMFFDALVLNWIWQKGVLYGSPCKFAPSWS